MIRARYKLLIETAMIVAAIVAAKFAIGLAGLEFMVLSTLFTSIIAGGVFVLSIILSGVIADFKESEKLPADIATSAENIYDDASAIKAGSPGFDLESMRLRLIGVLEAIVASVKSGTPEATLKALSEVSTSFMEMERLGVPPNYLVRLRQELSLIKKAVLRIHHIQRMQFLPSAFVFAETTVVLIVGLLLVTRLEPRADAMVLVAFVSYLFVFLIKLIRLLETPFESGRGTQDEISLLHLREAMTRLNTKPVAVVALAPKDVHAA